MGLHLCYELHLSGDTPEEDVRAQYASLVSDEHPIRPEFEHLEMEKRNRQAD